MRKIIKRRRKRSDYLWEAVDEDDVNLSLWKDKKALDLELYVCVRVMMPRIHLVK